jgi:hypothetical protein
LHAAEAAVGFDHIIWFVASGEAFQRRVIE